MYYILCLLMGLNIGGNVCISGVYQGMGQLNLVVNDNRIEGYFQAYRGNDFSTLFFLTGSMAGNEPCAFSIQTFYPGAEDTIKGKITFLNENDVRLDLEKEPPGGEFSIKGTSDDFERSAVKRWKALGFINEEKVFVKAFPGDEKESRGYLVRNNCVAITDSSEGYSKIEYLGKDKVQIAWIPTSAIQLLK